MPTIADAYAAMNLLKSHLQTRLDADYANVFAPYEGADVILEDDEPEDAEQVGKPYIVLRVDDDTDAPDWGENARSVRVNASCEASEFTGAQTGAANPINSDVLLSSALIEIIGEDWNQLMNQGLNDIRIRRGRPQRNDEELENTKPHDITFVIFS